MRKINRAAGSILSESRVIAFLPSTNLINAKYFFETKLGLKLTHADEMALEFNIAGSKLRVVKVTQLNLANYTLFGLEVDDIDSSVNELIAQGIEFEKYDGFSQNKAGICIFPGGGKVAWFKDPDGNTLSITQVEK